MECKHRSHDAILFPDKFAPSFRSDRFNYHIIWIIHIHVVAQYSHHQFNAYNRHNMNGRVIHQTGLRYAKAVQAVLTACPDPRYGAKELRRDMEPLRIYPASWMTCMLRCSGVSCLSMPSTFSLEAERRDDSYVSS